MLHIIRQYRQLFMGFIANGFAEKSAFNADEYKNNLDEASRKEILKNNSKAILDYINSLDKNKDKIIVSKFWVNNDDFSWANLTENIKNEQILKKIMSDLGLDNTKLSNGVSISEIVNALDSYSSEKNTIINTSKKDTGELFLPNWYSNSLEHQTESGYEVSIDNRNWVFVLRVDDLGFNDSIKLFKNYPTESQIQQALSDYEKSDDLENTGWWDEDDFDDMRKKFLWIKEEKAKDKIHDEPIKTPEVSWEVKTTFWSTEQLADYKNNVNFKSFESILTNMNYSDLLVFVKQLQQTAWENHFDPETNELQFNLFNTGKLEDLFKTKWYEADWIFWPEEVASLFRLFSDTLETQQKFTNTNLDYTDSIKILLDYDFDGLLDNENKFYTNEKEFLLAFKSEKDFTNLLSSLGYKNYDDFKSKMANNYFNERTEFKNRLGTVLHSGLNINPVEMMISPDAIKDKVATMNRIQEEFEKNPKFKAIEAKDKRLADLIKYEWAGAIFGSMNGWAVSFDISKLTYNFIDKLAFGVVNWTIWIVIDKSLYSDDTFNLNVWASNFIPYIAWSAKVFESTMEDFKDIFPKKVGNDVKVTIWGTVFLTWSWWAWIDVSKVDEDTKAGIEKMKGKMGDSLDIIFDLVKDWKDFSETWINDTKENRQAYDRLKWLHKSFGEAWINFLKQGALNNYERELYKNAEWLNFAWVSVWVISAFGYLMPVIWVHAEYHSTKWEQSQQAWENLYKVETKTVVDKYSKSVEWIETNNTSLAQAVKNLDWAITYRTRTNKYADVIMNPNLSIDERWTWLENFANRNWKYSKELQTTIKAFRDVLSAANKQQISPNDKMYILSTVVQLMKKSNDTNEGNIDKYNSDYEKLIAMKNNRRKGYNELFGFNTDTESKAFDEKLAKAGSSKNIKEVNLTGISFDASASKQVWLGRKTEKWVDVFLSNIQVLANWNEPIFVPITDKNKIDWFVSTLSGLNNINPILKKELIDGVLSWEIALNYYSDPDWFDDRIILLSKWGKEITNLEEREGISVYKPKFDTDKYGLAFWIDVKSHKPITPERQNDKWVSSTPDQDVDNINNHWTSITDTNTNVPMNPSTPTNINVDTWNSWKPGL